MSLNRDEHNGDIAREALTIFDRVAAGARAELARFKGPSAESLAPLNTLTTEKAVAKLSASVNERGREIGKVIDWNEQYGEIKKKKKKKTFSMYL